MNVLVGCEFSGVVRDAFIARGHNAMSCDLIPSERTGPHYQGDLLDIIDSGWDMLIAFPPCTYLCRSGARWWSSRLNEQLAALEFVKRIMCCSVPRISVENPIGLISTAIRKPDCIVQPYMFGHQYTKATCLWLKNLPVLQPSNIVEPEYVKRSDGTLYLYNNKRSSPLHFYSGKDRSKFRSRTCSGMAQAMARQWGNPYICTPVAS